MLWVRAALMSADRERMALVFFRSAEGGLNFASVSNASFLDVVNVKRLRHVTRAWLTTRGSGSLLAVAVPA